MKSIFLTLLGIVFFGLTHAQQKHAYFTSFPCISPDGNHIVFTYEGDLWKASIDGGFATRLTAMLGEETRAKYSPDGKWIAFTGSQYGNQDVYILPADGGEVKQLTFHEAFDHVDNWSWDSKEIYFTSSRENRNSAYVVPISGGTPKRLFHNFFHTLHNIAMHPDGEIFFSETSESKAQAYRKGYKGSYNPEIQSYNPKTNNFKKYTKYEGKDMWPTIDRQGNVYFVSDEKNGQYNLSTLNKSKTSHLTDFKSSIKHPVVSADGRYVVFEKDFQIFKYEVRSGKTSKVPVVTFTNATAEKEKDFTVQNNISYFDVSADGKKLAFVSRGELFVSDIKGKFIQKLKTNPLARVTEVKWKSDNKSLLYTQTNTKGYTNLFLIRADTIPQEKQLTYENQNNRELSLNKSRTKAVFLSGRNDVKIIDLHGDSVATLVKEELWGFQNSTPSFSPNDEYILFTARRNFEEDIFLYHLENKKLTNLTKTGITENSPFWSPDGKYIYFTSNRIKPAYPFGLSDARVYRLPLEKFSQDFRSNKYDSLFIEKSKSVAPKTDSLNTKPIMENYTIDFNNILDRVELVSPNFGTQSRSYVLRKEDKTVVIYSSNHSENENHLWMTTYEPFEKPKTEKIEGARSFGTFIVQSSDKYYALIGGNVHTLNIDGKKTEKINIDHTFRRNLKAEFDQMFAETWANVQENFYNKSFHGLDWNQVGEHYKQFLTFVNTRSDLRVLITEMLGDLNSSHTGFSSFGDEENTFYKTTSLGTGIVWDNDDPYKVKRVITYSPSDKKGIDLIAGDVLTAINDTPVDVRQNRESYFIKPSLDQELQLTFSRKDSSFTIKITPESFNAINTLRYDEWIANNQKIVDQKSNKKIAYAHMKDMGTGELNKFLIDMTTEIYDRDALILDIRYNNGGNVHDNVLQFLSQKPYLKWKYREGALTVQPNFTPAGKPIILLTNEQSLSDAEMTTEGFKRLGLGKVIGTETYRWIIFTSGKGLVDGSFYRLPSWGCYTLDGKNLELVGVAPDIYVGMDFKDRLNQVDPQLDRAISEIMSMLK
ncbi:MAG: PD40 domain-containing protein [Saprospiraceae bacterium]|nr:PD40 domain-containing protein [Saprospiraceae bacterium]